MGAMGGPTVIFSIAAIAIGVGIICYVLLRKPKTAAKLPISEIVIGESDNEESATEEKKEESAE
jgi:hypothetical protein